MTVTQEVQRGNQRALVKAAREFLRRLAVGLELSEATQRNAKRVTGASEGFLEEMQ